jgi:hypothetical protein
MGPQSQRPDGLFGRIVRHFQPTIRRVARQRLSACQHVADCPRQRALAADLRQRAAREDFEIGRYRATTSAQELRRR